MQPKSAAGLSPAPHVQAAFARCRPPAGPAVQPRAATPERPPAPHVQAAVAPAEPRPRPVAPAVQPKADDEAAASAQGRDALGFVSYTDQKTPTTPPPPPRWPVYALHCGDQGGCRLQDVRTGRWRDPGTMYAGFVRMQAGGPVYVSPRPALGFPGDSHPTIASGTPEGQRGKRALVAAGEVGIVGGQVVGHNDKTGHYKTRKNLWQSGLPPELYHPFTEDPEDWFRAPAREAKSPGEGS